MPPPRLLWERYQQRWWKLQQVTWQQGPWPFVALPIFPGGNAGANPLRRCPSPCNLCETGTVCTECAEASYLTPTGWTVLPAARIGYKYKLFCCWITMFHLTFGIVFEAHTVKWFWYHMTIWCTWYRYYISILIHIPHDHVLKRAEYQLNCPTNLNAVFRHTFAVSLEWVYVEALWDFPRPNYQQKDKAKNWT